MRMLNLGCGPVQPAGWVNVDGSVRAWFASRWSVFDRTLTGVGILPKSEFNRTTSYANLSKTLPWDANSVDAVYMGEMLEHFTQADGIKLLAECHRVLKPDGILRIRVPDNMRFWRNYLQEFDAAYAKPRAEWTEKHTRWVEMFFRDICVQRKFRGSFGHYHKFMYDEISLIGTLERAGFRNVERRKYLESSIPNVKAVETHEDLTVEGIKPA